MSQHDKNASVKAAPSSAFFRRAPQPSAFKVPPSALGILFLSYLSLVTNSSNYCGWYLSPDPEWCFTPSLCCYDKGAWQADVFLDLGTAPGVAFSIHLDRAVQEDIRDTTCYSRPDAIPAQQALESIAQLSMDITKFKAAQSQAAVCWFTLTNLV